MAGMLLFCAGVVVSLAASWLLVSRLERLGERAGFSEAWLGLVAALAADAPEVTAAVTALSRGQASVGAGVVIGSNVFNLAALLGLAAVVAGWIGFHRRVVVLAGVPAVWVGAVCLLTVAAVVAPGGRAGPDRRSAGAVRGGPGHAPHAAGAPAAAGPGGSGGWSRRSTRRRPNSPRRSDPAGAPGVTRSPRPRR